MFKNKAILVIASAMLAMPAVVQAQGVTPTAGGKGGTVAADQIIARYKTFAGSEANAKSLVNGLRNGSDITLASEEEVCTASKTTCSEYEQTCGTYGQTCTTTTPCLQTAGCLPGSPGCVNGSKCVLFGTPKETCVTDYSKCTLLVDSDVCKPGMSTTTCTASEKQPKSMTFPPGPATPMGFGNVDIALALTEARLRPNVAPAAPDAIKTKLLEILDKRAAGQGWGDIAKGYGFELK
jgi:hypothetical protein